MPVLRIPTRELMNLPQKPFDMKFLITGANGQLGKEWVRFLELKGLPFDAFGSSKLDITNEEDVRKRLKECRPDVVINCAAYTNVDEAEDQTQLAYSVNETGVEHLVSACLEYNCKLVHFSTDYVFPGNYEDGSKFPEGYPEDAEKRPVNAYGRSKRAGEIIIENSPLDCLLMRVSWLCGPFGNNFVKTMLRLAETRNELSVVDDQKGSPSFTFDVVEKCFKLLTSQKSGVYHISSEGKISWADFAEEIFNQSDLMVKVNRIPSSEFPTKAKRPAFSLLSNQKLEKEGLNVLAWKAGLSVLLKKLNHSL
jgi:dTDP-4-dehydrorhamnose reductase